MQKYGGYRIIAPNGNPGIANLSEYRPKSESNLPIPLRVPELKSGDLADLKIWDQPVFAEYNSQGNLQFFYGLKNHLLLEWENTSIAIIDNHNHALYHRYRSYLDEKFSKGIHLIHLDQHSDARSNPYHIWAENLTAIETFCNEQCQVGNFIAPAIQSGLIGSVENILSEYQLLNFELNKSEYLLDIDCDFWDPRMGIEQEQKVLTITRELIKGAKFVTIATSPYFLDQQLAIKIIHKLLV